MKTFDLITKEDLQEFKAELLEDLKQHLKRQVMAQNTWLRSSEVRKLLKISPGTLQNLRINGSLGYNKIGSIHYYRLEDIQASLEGREGTIDQV
ncbi:helix-turn-helix domain-containing protein [Pedobacter sp. SYP-B3415]|uniref:helix-turn-helix domain-containing protein n=1 Tax=Pedobacter sp. SYP-B3415 TaxID=2496641 RepID=UPI00101D0F41|nr:helix-turn-helix domain-containing protein [Pedobacter sp. SYP-B3415]